MMRKPPRSADTMPGQSATARAQALVRTHGRATAARVRVLSALLTADSALSHGELESILAHTGGIDRVTIYRVLDWLIERGLAHRLAGEDRVWRFSASPGSRAPHDHAHFHCDGCGRTYCLDALRPVFALSLPAGFHYRAAELTLYGSCPRCSLNPPA